MNGVKYEYDDKVFQATFRDYVKVMSRTLVQAINDKLFSVARAALWNTHKADSKHISRDLGKIVALKRKNGERRWRHNLKKGTQHTSAPLAALIINARAEEGEGLNGPAMRKAIHEMITARNVSIAYIKSGWLPAIQALAQVSSIKTHTSVRDDKRAQQIGKPKGRATIAKPGNKIIGMIENVAWARRDKNKAAYWHYGGKGLQLGFDNEVMEMKSYINRKIKPPADAFNKAQR